MDAIVRKLGLLTLIFGAILYISCKDSYVENDEEDCATYNYSDCNTLEPYTADVKLSFTIKNNASVAFEIIEGRIEDGKTIVYDTTNTSVIYYNLPIPQYYTVKAIYKNGDNTIFAIDGVEMKATEVHKCDSICWDLQDFELDLRIQ